jgi:hypothetical protein
MTLAGHHNWFAARLGFLALNAILPPLTAALSYSLASRHDLALIASLLAVFSGYYAPYLPLTDTFGICMLFGALFFLIVNRKSSIVNSLLLGLLAGLIHLSRADGLLWLLMAFVVAILGLPKPSQRRPLFTSYSLRLFARHIPLAGAEHDRVPHASCPWWLTRPLVDALRPALRLSCQPVDFCLLVA